MLLPAPPLYPRRRKQRNVKPPSPVPPGPPIHVEFVSTDDPPSPGYAQWFFDQPVTVTGPVSGLAVNIDGSWKQPLTAVQGDTISIVCTYDTVETLDGKPYQTEGPITGILQAAEIQDASGTVVTP